MSVDMSPGAITYRIKKLSQLRELCMSLKIAGENNKLNVNKELDLSKNKGKTEKSK